MLIEIEATALLTALGGESDRLAHAEADLADPSAPERLISQAVERWGTLDALVLNHARSQRGTVAEFGRKHPGPDVGDQRTGGVAAGRGIRRPIPATPAGWTDRAVTSGQH